MRREKLGFVEEFSIVGKSIPLSDSKKVLQSLSSSSSSSSSSTLSLPCSTSITLERLSIIENPMRHSRRINQLYSTICPHEHQLKHEIANHIRDVKNRTFLRKVRNKAKRTLAAKVIQRLRKTKSSGFSTAKNAFNSMIRRRRRHRRQFPINQRNSLQIPSITFPRQNPNKLREETTPTTKRGRQTLCNSIQQRGIGNDELIKIRSAKTFDQLLALIKRQSKRHSKNNRSEIDVFCTSNNSTIDGNRKFVSKSPEETSATSVIPVNSTVRRNFTTKKHRSQFETKAPANYCNSLEHRTIHKSNQNRSGHVSINNQNKTDWFIELASDCYKSGFQLHLNYLNECAKNHRITIRKQNKSIEPSICQTSSTILHLPSSALFRRSVSTEALTQSIALSDSASCASDIVSCTLKNSKKPHCDRHTNPLINDRLANCHQQLFKYHGDIQFQQQSTNQTNSSIISIEKKSFSSRKSVQLSAIRTIPNNCYSSQSTTISSSIIPEQNLSNNKIDAKNNMSAVAVDANEQQTNPQLSCQAIQFNNNYSHRHRHSTSHNQDGNSNHLNSQFRQNIGQFNEHPDQLTINNNYYQLSGKVDSDSGSGGSARNHIPLHLINSRCEVKQTTSTSPTASPVINDLIKSFNNSLDVSDIDKRILPQIVLSDFSTSDLTTPPISSLLFATQSIHSFSTLDSATSSGFLNLS